MGSSLPSSFYRGANQGGRKRGSDLSTVTDQVCQSQNRISALHFLPANTFSFSTPFLSRGGGGGSKGQEQESSWWPAGTCRKMGTRE